MDTAVRLGPLKPIWSYFGYDEPNYTYMKHGQKLIGELAAMNYSTVHVRAHNLLTTGDGTPSLKWGSTNAYTEDASGKPVYDFTIVDRIFDTYIKAKAKPFVEIGFTPEALSMKPQPYRHTFPEGSVYTGWSYPPKDLSKWEQLIVQWVKHEVERYGLAEVESWYWEVWNEPDISYWHGTPEEYNKLYDVSVRAVKSVAPRARVGGPGSTGPASAKAAAFLKQFLEHCAREKSPLDFISYHAKGSPKVVEGHVRMDLAKEMRDVERGMEVIAEFPQFRPLPIVLTEADPEGCAACGLRTHPQNGYRNGTLYAVYTAATLKKMYQLADAHHANLQGMLTWAFEFEDQPYFAGFRSLATNGIDKPVLNTFRMAGQMRGTRVKVVSSAAGQPEIDALAASGDREVSVLAYNYHDDETGGPDATVKLQISGLPPGAKTVLVHHYRIDQDHSNAYSAWQQMGSPQAPTAEQYRKLEAAGQLQLLSSPVWTATEGGAVELTFGLPRHAVSLVQLSW